MRAVVYGDNVRPRGGDVRAGEVVVPGRHAARRGADRRGGGGRRGRDRVRAEAQRRGRADRKRAAAARRARLSPGEIYESNAALLLVLCRSAGAEATRFEPVADNEEDTLAALARALEADVVVTTGGVSVGVEGPRAGCAREARRRGGVLARRGSSRQAGGLCGTRRDAGVRPARQSGVVAGGVRAVRPARRCERCRVRSLGRSTSRAVSTARCAATMHATISSARRSAPTMKHVWLEAAVGPVLPHDRAGGCRRRARPGSAWRGRARPRLGRSLPAALADRPPPRLGGLPPCPDESRDTADELAHRTARRVGGRARGTGRSGRTRSRPAARPPRRRRASGRPQPGRCSRGRPARAGTTERRSRGGSARRARRRRSRAGEPGGERHDAELGPPLAEVGQPDPGVQRRQGEQQRVRVGCHE